jgi:preprotein translocase subunit SecG
MSVVVTILLVVQVLSALVMIGLILIQQGKGADMGAAFGSGSSGSLFGASGSANFLSRTTGALAAVFFVSTLLLAYFGNVRPTGGTSVLEGAVVNTQVPAAAQQIPGNQPAAGGADNSIPAPAGSVPASSGAAGQIPTK